MDYNSFRQHVDDRRDGGYRLISVESYVAGVYWNYATIWRQNT